MRRFPVIADFLRSGRLTLTRVALLREVLTEQNHAEVLERATHGTEKDVERLVATLNPKPNVTDGIRKLPSPPPLSAMASSVPMPVPLASSTSAAPRPPETMSPPVGARELFAASESMPLAMPPPHQPGELPVDINARQPTPAIAPDFVHTTSLPAPRPHRMEIEATSGTTFSVRMSVGPEFVAEFEEVKAALSHKFPNGNFEAVMRECFRITLDQVKRRRTGAACSRSSGRTSSSVTSKPVQSASTSASGGGAAPTNDGSTSDRKPAFTTKPSRYIPAPVRQAVWNRDEGRCAFVSKDGRRCNSKYQVEVHHIDPYALGGPATEENLSLRCRQHNRHEAEVAFGADFMRSLPLWKCEDSAVPSLRLTDASLNAPRRRRLADGRAGAEVGVGRPFR